MDERKSWFFEKTSKTDKPLIREKKAQNSNTKNKRRGITTDAIGIERIVRFYNLMPTWMK